jgi:hypothetical protein
MSVRVVLACLAWASVFAFADSSSSAGVAPEAAAAGSAEFARWCTSVGIGLNSVGWVEGPGGPEDRVTVATAQITQGDPVLSVPLDTVLNVEHAVTDPVTMDAWDSDAGAALSEIDIMAGFIVHEKFKPSDSRWQGCVEWSGAQRSGHVCVCVRARARVRVRACVRACACVSVLGDTVDKWSGCEVSQ